MKFWSALLVVGLVAACGAKEPTVASGNFITTEHGTQRFEDAVKGAQQYCERRGMGVKHLGTDTAVYSVSRFECIPK